MGSAYVPPPYSKGFSVSLSKRFATVSKPSCFDKSATAPLSAKLTGISPETNSETSGAVPASTAVRISTVTKEILEFIPYLAAKELSASFLRIFI